MTALIFGDEIFSTLNACTVYSLYYSECWYCVAIIIFLTMIYITFHKIFKHAKTCFNMVKI